MWGEARSKTSEVNRAPKKTIGGDKELRPKANGETWTRVTRVNWHFDVFLQLYSQEVQLMLSAFQPTRTCLSQYLTKRKRAWEIGLSSQSMAKTQRAQRTTQVVLW